MNRKIIFICIIAFLLTGVLYIKSNYRKDQKTSEVMLNLFSIKTSHNLEITLPESQDNAKCAFLSFDKENLICKYTDGADRGTVNLNYRKIFALMSSTDQISYMAIPFSVSGSGSGIFHYIGIFKLDHGKGKIEHLSSHLLGDRIIINDIEQFSSKELRITLKTRADNIPMASKPDLTKIIILNFEL